MIFDYHTGKINNYIETDLQDLYTYAIVSLEEVKRQNLHKAIKVNTTAIESKKFILQGSKGIQIIDIENLQ